MKQWNRRWLWPTFYVEDLGDGLWHGHPRPSKATAVRNQMSRDGEPICVTCGVDVSGVSHYFCDRGKHCDTCHIAEHPSVALTGWRRKIQDLSIGLDNLYFAYASRFGRKIYR